MGKAVIYLRVSSSEQTTENQLPAMEKWVADRGYEVAEVYQESESAWKAGHQQELARLLDDLKSGRRRFDAVLVWALDRLSRQGAAAILNLVNTFKLYGCRVISLQEPWTEAPGMLGELLFALVGWVAQMESERRSERTKAGQARAVREGKRLGRPPGRKDKKPRRKSGYYQRWAGKKVSAPVMNEAA